MSDPGPQNWASRIPAWWGVIVALAAAIAGFGHLQGATAENTRQIVLLWTRSNDTQKVAADIASIKAHAEDTEKHVDQIDSKIDHLLDQRTAAPAHP